MSSIIAVTAVFQAQKAWAVMKSDKVVRSNVVVMQSDQVD